MDKLLDKATTAIDTAACNLEELSDAFWYLREGFESEGYQHKTSFNDWKAISFAQRFPMYLSVYDVLINSVSRIVKELKKESAEILAAQRTPPSM